MIICGGPMAASRHSGVTGATGARGPSGLPDIPWEWKRDVPWGVPAYWIGKRWRLHHNGTRYIFRGVGAYETDKQRARRALEKQFNGGKDWTMQTAENETFDK